MIWLTGVLWTRQRTAIFRFDGGGRGNVARRAPGEKRCSAGVWSGWASWTTERRFSGMLLSKKRRADSAAAGSPFLSRLEAVQVAQGVLSVTAQELLVGLLWAAWTAPTTLS